MTVGERIKNRREEIGMTVDELAEKLGKNRATIYRYERGDIEKLPIEILEPISRALDVSPGCLMGWKDEPPLESNVSAVYDNSTYMIPLFNEVAAGFGAYADEQVLEYVPVFVESPVKAKNMIAIRVRGDSMYPKIEDGDTIIVLKTDEVESGKIAVVLIDGDEAVVKKLEYNKKQAVLVSINPEYKDRVFEGEEVKRLRVVGRVVQILKYV